MGKPVKYFTDYHDYIYKNGEFVGKSEEMYQYVESPWHHGEANETHYDMVLCLFSWHKMCNYIRRG